MMNARWVFLIVTMTVMVAPRQAMPLVVAPVTQTSGVFRQTWIERIRVGLFRSLAHKALFQRVAFELPQLKLPGRGDLTTRSPQPILYDRFRFCLPPPLGYFGYEWSCLFI